MYIAMAHRVWLGIDMIIMDLRPQMVVDIPSQDQW